MKKVLFILIATLTLGIVAKAQTEDGKGFVQPTVATQSGRFSQGLEVGNVLGKNRASFVGTSYDDGNNRQYFAGIKYARAVHQGEILDFLLTGAAFVHINSQMALSVEPGAELDFKLSKVVSLVGAISAPLYQEQTPFKSLNLKGSAGVQVKF